MNPPPPPVADASANAALTNAYAGPNPNASTRAGRAAKRAKVSTDLHIGDSNLVTIQEVGDQAIFATEAALAGVGGAAVALPNGAPGWAVAMNANMVAGFANMVAGFAAVNANLANITARQSNAVAAEHGDPIHPITNNAGNATGNISQHSRRFDGPPRGE